MWTCYLCIDCALERTPTFPSRDEAMDFVAWVQSWAYEQPYEVRVYVVPPGGGEPEFNGPELELSVPAQQYRSWIYERYDE